MNPSGQEIPSIFSLVWRRKKIFLAVVGLCFAGGIAYTLFAPAVWEAKATIVFPVHTPSLLGVGSFDQQSIAATLTGGATPIKVYGGMLESEHALDLVASRSGLTKRRIKDMRTLQDQIMESSITISARDTNADLAKQVVALHLQALDEINREISAPLTSSDANVLASKVETQKKRVAAAEQNLLTFQNHALTAPSLSPLAFGKDSKLGPTTSPWAQALKELELNYFRVDASIRDIESRTHAIAGTGGTLPADLPPVVKWRDKLTDMQYNLRMQELTLAPNAPELVKLRKEIGITQQELQSELQKYASATSSGMVDPTGDDKVRLPSLLTERVVIESELKAVRKLAALAPTEAIELGRLTREVTTQSEILVELQGQHELAKLQADRDPNRWEVLDTPEVDDKPVNKSLSKNGALSLIVGFALGALASLAWPRPKASRRTAGTHEDLKQAA